MSCDRISKDADLWFLRNKEALDRREADPVLDVLRSWDWAARDLNYLEIGCADGRRLDKLLGETSWQCMGIEAGASGVEAALSRGRNVVQGVAPSCLTHYLEGAFDIVVIGFIQYLLPREYEFQLAAEVDRILAGNGRIIVQDFLSPLSTSKAYSHDSELRVWKGDPSAAWTWHPKYALIGREVRHHETFGAVPEDTEHWMTVDSIQKLGPETSYYVL